MKNQYFADVNDYRKYGLLRHLASVGLRVGVCWMLTQSDGRADGRFIKYWREPAKWRCFDSELYDALARCDKHSILRNVKSAHEWGLIPGATYHESDLMDAKTARAQYFDFAFGALAGSDLIFFDPDNGLEVASVPAGRKKSNKYLYWREVQRAFGLSKSLLIYQHFPREKRDPYMKRRAQELTNKTGARRVLLFATPFVLFLLAAQAKHHGMAEDVSRLVGERWKGQIWRV